MGVRPNPGRRSLKSLGERFWRFRGSAAWEAMARKGLIVSTLGSLGVMAYVNYSISQGTFGEWPTAAPALPPRSLSLLIVVCVPSTPRREDCHRYVSGPCSYGWQGQVWAEEARGCGRRPKKRAECREWSEGLRRVWVAYMLACAAVLAVLSHCGCGKGTASGVLPLLMLVLNFLWLPVRTHGCVA